MKKSNEKSCFVACSPSDFYEGGKCDKMGCFQKSDNNKEILKVETNEIETMIRQVAKVFKNIPSGYRAYKSRLSIYMNKSDFDKYLIELSDIYTITEIDEKASTFLGVKVKASEDQKEGVISLKIEI